MKQWNRFFLVFFIFPLRLTESGAGDEGHALLEGGRLQLTGGQAEAGREQDVGPEQQKRNSMS
jgi:hypothetical protein